MRTFTFVALTNAVPGREQEFNDWYDNQHVKDVLAIPGFVAAQRFERVGGAVRAVSPYRYLATYEVVTDDPDAALQEQDIYAVLYEARSPQVSRKSAEGSLPT
jgi:hypothetical protein